MANEFIARKGLIVLTNGAKITGSLDIQGDVDASEYAVTASYFVGDGSFLTNIASSLNFSGSSGGSDTLNLKTDTLNFSGSNGLLANVSDNTITFALPGGTISASSQVDHDATTNFVTNEHIDHSTVSITAGAGLNGGGDITTTRTLSVNSGSMLPYYSSSIFGTVSGDILITTAGVASIQPDSVALGTDTTGNYAEAVSAGGGISVGGVAGEGTTFSVTLDTGSTHFTDGVKAKLNADGVISSSTQISVIGYATTGSNTFTGIQTITDDTNSTNFADGALVVQGGVGIAKDVNISGSLNVTGLLTVVSMSTQYVTSSQFVVGTSRIILNDDDLVRFAGLSIIDSGSTPASASILWDSLNNHFIIETDDVHENTVDPHSAILIAGPETYEDVGNEIGLVEGRVPIATSDHNIDNRPESSSIRIIPVTLETHIEHGLYVTGSVTASAFNGDGSNLTGIVTNLTITGSQGGTGTVALKTQSLTVSGSNGIAVTANNQTFAVAGVDATTTTKGVASFNTTNFTVTDGAVSSNNISINGTNVTLGGTRNITLSEITSASATTPDQLVLDGGAIIHGILYTSGSNSDVDTGTEVIVTIPTGSYDAAHFDYVVKKSGNLRTGTVMAVWESGTTNIEFTDTSTNDLGDTAEVVFTADTLSGNARLLATVTSTDWNIKTAARLI
jgi:hypothetical protein